MSEQRAQDPEQGPPPAAADPAAADGAAPAPGAGRARRGAHRPGRGRRSRRRPRRPEASPSPSPTSATSTCARRPSSTTCASARGATWPRPRAAASRGWPSELLPALDDFERALAAAESQPENQDHHLTDGIRLVQAELLGALKRVGSSPTRPKGEQFDPHRHEALAQQPAEGAESGTIIEVY